MIKVPDGKIIRLYVDEEAFKLEQEMVVHYERAPDFRAGTLEREVLWETPAGKQVKVRSRRLVSFTDRHLAALWYEVKDGCVQRANSTRNVTYAIH
jgi:alpha,alpha-trehalose phosphorylase